ncbi:MAG: cadmium-translocating P-type ATPase [Ignavibacteria bacterium]|nr:cadmium-translocating P-type ATPase [Ignavibacteria bacterium]
MQNSTNASEKISVNKPLANEELYEFDVIGMNCSGCAQSIKSYLEKTKGVNSVEVNFTSEICGVTYRPAQISRSEIKKHVESLGFGVSSDDDEYETDIKRKKSLNLLRLKIYVSAILSLIIMFLSMKDHFNIPFIHLPEKAVLIILFALTSVVIFWCGEKFIRGTYNSLKSRKFDMNTLISLGSLSSFFYSTAIAANTVFDLKIEAFNSNKEVYFETAAMIVTFILIGNYLETVLKTKTQSSVKKLKDLQAKVVNIIRDGNELFVPFKKVKLTDIVIVKTGDKIPVDGPLIEGFGVVDESAMTGESLPIEKSIGDFLISGTVLKNGFLKMTAEKVGDDTMLSRIIALVKDASAQKPKIQKLADKISAVFVPVVILISIVTFAVWYFALNTPFDKSLLFAVSVLIIACPCALGLASPIAIVLGVGRAAENGILFNNIDGIENLMKVNTMCFDKTGTLTTGVINVKNVYVFNGYTRDQILKMIYSLEKHSSHPIAKSIVKYSLDNNITSSFEVKDFITETGLGVSALVNDKRVTVGNEEFLKKNNVSFSNIIFEASKSNLFVAINGEISGVVEIDDELKENAASVIKKLKKKGIDIFMISGDNDSAARRVAIELEIEDYSSRTLPDEKEKIVTALQSKSRNVGMVGDGINDAPSLAKANVGIAVGTGQDIAIDSADVILVKDDLNNLLKAINISKKTVTVIKENFFWAFFYNALAIPIAAGVFVPFGIVIGPVMAAMLMAFSDVVTVLGNSLRLKYVKIDG